MMVKIDLMKESEMVEEFLNQQSNSGCFFREVPIFAKSVDVVQYDALNKMIYAIEFKTSKWRKAKSQVLGSASAFDYLEICILKPATEKCRNLIIDECSRDGIGVYFLDNIDKTIEHVVKPIHRNDIWEIQRKQIFEYIERR